MGVVAIRAASNASGALFLPWLARAGRDEEDFPPVTTTRQRCDLASVEADIPEIQR